MLIVSMLLMLLAKKQRPMLRKMGTGWEVPARILNFAISGPGFGLSAFIRAPMPRSMDRPLDYDRGGDRWESFSSGFSSAGRWTAEELVKAEDKNIQFRLAFCSVLVL